MTTTFPAYPVNTEGSDQTPVEDLVVDQWPNGNSRGRSYFTTGKFSWTLVHGAVASADEAILKAFYDANRLLTFDYVSPWDGVTYHNVGFTAPLIYKRLPGGFYDVTAKLRQML